MRHPRGIARQAVSRLEKPLYERGIFSVSSLTLPDFLGIGAMKSGTTWLYENLRCHPDAYLPDRKELYYFSHAFYDGRLKRYSSQFQKGAGKIKGEITPGYATIPVERIRFIRRVMPNVRLIFIARNPIDRSWSEAYMNLIAKPGKSIAEVTGDELIDYLTTGGCCRRSDYLQILDSWHSIFPSDQLFLGTLDEIRQNPVDFLTRLFLFLGLSTDVDWSCFPASNVVKPRYESNRMVYRGEVSGDTSPSHMLMPDEVRDLLSDIYAPQIEELANRYGISTRTWK